MIITAAPVLVLSPAWAADAPTTQREFVAPVKPSAVVLEGYLGERVDRNLRSILLHKDEKALLEPFRQRKCRDQARAGEHVGKWLSAAAMTRRSWRSPETSLPAPSRTYAI